MATSKIGSLRAAATSCIIGAAATALGGIAVQAIVQPTTNASRTTDGATRGRAPHSSPSHSCGRSCTSHLLRVARVRAQPPCRPGPKRSSSDHARARRHRGSLRRRAGLDPDPRPTHPRHRRHDRRRHSSLAAILLTAAGFLLAGIATLRARLWRDWRRFTPLSVGIASCALLGLNTTHALPAGVAVYGVCLFALGVALYTEPAPTADTRALTAQEQYA